VNLEKMGYEGPSRLKELCKNGYVDIFRHVFEESGSKLDEYVRTILAGCTYADTKSFKVPLEWSRVFSLMSLYGLDSSDAMILNLAVSDRTFKGIISGDYDFIHCATDIDVILPKARPAPPTKKCVIPVSR
jgi:hypothetical protein